MEYITITTNVLSDEFVAVEKLQAETEEQAYEVIDETEHNYDRTTLLTPQQFQKLKKEVNKIDAL